MAIKMFNRRLRSRAGRLITALAVIPVLGACDSLFEVENPNVIDASTVDPVADGTIFSRSAFQSFAAALGNYIVYTAWFSNEAWVGDTFPTRNEFGRRLVDDRNGTHNGEVFFPLARGIAQSEQVMEILGSQPGQELNVARAALAAGYGILLQGEAFCEGTFRASGNKPGPLFNATQLLEQSLTRFDAAIQNASAATGTEATNIAQAARVGKGRALLQLGRRSEAATAVAGVPANFVFNVPFVDDAGNRGRLGNGVYFFSAGGSREALVVPPHYRSMSDKRVTFVDAGRNAQDATLRMWSQTKYPSWAASIPLASGLEARYIAAEASQDAGTILALVNERRAVGGQTALAATSNMAELMTALMEQRSRDFWLEGKRMGDWRRNPNAVPNILQPGKYYKDGIGDVSNQTCLPLPFAEKNANPNIGS